MIAIYLSYKPLREAICYNGGFCYKTCDSYGAPKITPITCTEVEIDKNYEFLDKVIPFYEREKPEWRKNAKTF